MNERIKELAEQAGFWFFDYDVARCDVDEIERFAELVRQDYLEDLSGQCMKTVVKAVEIEREACAKLCESLEIDGRWFANKIRARGEK